MSTYEPSKDDVMFSSQQLQQLLKLMPENYGVMQEGSDIEEELKMVFSCIVDCNLSMVSYNTWIIDSGASDHMTCFEKGCAILKLQILTLPSHFHLEMLQQSHMWVI